MDTITQGLLGAAAAQAVLARRLGPRTWLFGALGGMAADLDIVIRSSDDPMVALTYHRHFTHSLAFIPIGGLICALPWLLGKRPRAERWLIAAATTIGYATHALLDAFTSYGTQLLWPFTRTRIAWDFVAIVDPIYSLILLAGVLFSRRRRSPRPAMLAMIASSAYLALGGVLHARAVTAARTLAHERGHALSRVDAFPQIPVNFLWRTVYRAGGRVYVDEVRTPWFGATTSRTGDSLAVVEQASLPADVVADPRTHAAWNTFVWFADGWVGIDPSNPRVFADMRYGIETGGTTSLWALDLRPGDTQPVRLQQNRPNGGDFFAQRWHDITGD
jgi:inner membrane protein